MPRFPNLVLPPGGYAGFIVATELVVASLLDGFGSGYLSPPEMVLALPVLSIAVVAIWWLAVPLKMWDVLPLLAIGSPLFMLMDGQVRPWKVMISSINVVLMMWIPLALGRSAAPFRIPPPRVLGVAPGPFTNTDTFKVRDDRAS